MNNVQNLHYLILQSSADLTEEATQSQNTTESDPGTEIEVAVEDLIPLFGFLDGNELNMVATEGTLLTVDESEVVTVSGSYSVYSL